jgi:hypothetical protein
LGVAERFAEIVAMFPEAPLLIMAFSPVGTALPDQLLGVFQSVLVVPVQSAASAAERPNETANMVTR